MGGLCGRRESRLTACESEDMGEAGERKGGCGSRRLEGAECTSAEAQSAEVQGASAKRWEGSGETRRKRDQGRPSSSVGLA